MRGRRDLLLLLDGRVLRALAFGFGAVLLGLQLEARGLSPAENGLALTIGVLAAAVTGLSAARLSVRIGRRRVLFAVGVAMAVTGVVLAAATSSALLIGAGLTGMLGAAGLDVGPFLTIEQPMLTEAVGPGQRNLAFARYSLSGALAGALGGFAATAAGGGAGVIGGFYGLFAAIGLATAVIPLALSA